MLTDAPLLFPPGQVNAIYIADCLMNIFLMILFLFLCLFSEMRLCVFSSFMVHVSLVYHLFPGSKPCLGIYLIILLRLFDALIWL